VTVQDDYDGDFQTRRFVTHTLNFTLKTNLFGSTNTQGVIDQVNANVGENENFSNPNRVYVAQGNPATGTVTQENWEDNF